MKNIKFAIRSSLLLSISLFLFINGQELDDLDEEMSQDDVVCEPESYTTPHEYLKANELSGDQVKLKFSYLVDYAKKKNWDKVKKYGWELVYGDKNRMFKSVYDKLGDSYFYSNSPDTTLLICQMGLNDVGDRTRLHYYAGYIQFKLGKYKCAEPHYTYLTKKTPTNIDYWRYLTQCQVKQDKIEAAIASQQKVVDLSNNDTKEMTLLAQLMESGGGDAMNAYLDSWNSNPTVENIPTAIQVTTMAIQQGRENDGIKVGLEALKIDPKNKVIIRNVADLYNSKLEYNNALNYYNKYTSIDSKNCEVYCSIADIYREKQNWSKARANANTARRINPNSGKPHITLANIYQSAASECLNSKYDGKINIDIKLVFKMAYDEFGKALKDPAFKVEASNKRSWLKSSKLIPDEEDKFLHGDVKEPRLDCFNWI